MSSFEFSGRSTSRQNYKKSSQKSSSLRDPNTTTNINMSQQGKSIVVYACMYRLLLYIMYSLQLYNISCILAMTCRVNGCSYGWSIF